MVYEIGVKPGRDLWNVIVFGRPRSFFFPFGVK